MWLFILPLLFFIFKPWYGEWQKEKRRKSGGLFNETAGSLVHWGR